DTNAINFYNLVTNKFNKPDILLLTNQDASLEKVRTFLGGRVQNLSPFPLFIFYFAGHGTRQLHRNAGGWNETFLMLSDGNQTDPYFRPTNAIALDDVLKAISGLDRGTAMVFLDCCHSARARSPFEHPEDTFAKV